MSEIPQWEYLHLQPMLNEKGRIRRRLNQLGAEGWEAISLAVDKGLSITGMNVLLRRPILAPDPPTDLIAAWHPDPTGRFEKRYWDGQFWTVHVANITDERVDEDPPTMLPPSALEK